MITIITGAPGTGKTTVSRKLAEQVSHGVHVPSDLFYSFIANCISPNEPEADHQNHMVIKAILSSAMVYSADGYDVILDGVFGPWFLPYIKEEIKNSERKINYVILVLPVLDAIQRINNRQEYLDERIVRQMHHEFERSQEGWQRHLVKTDNLTVDAIANEIITRRQNGEFLIEIP